jgi:hypothetical protein
VTDTKETEYNYLTGLRHSLSADLQNRLVIKVIRKIQPKCLVDEALRLRFENPQYAELWIVFDKDENVTFDQIIRDAENNGIRVGWSNPCIEIWFHSYLGEMPSSVNSLSCCTNFGNAFMKKSQYRYKKSNLKIYEALCIFGNESKAIELAINRYRDYRENNICKPSEMIPGTTMHELIGEIKCKCRHESLKR